MRGVVAFTLFLVCMFICISLFGPVIGTISGLLLGFVIVVQMGGDV